MTLDTTTIIQFVLGCACTLGGWFMRELWDAVGKLRADVAALEVDLAKNYVPWDRLHAAMQPLHETLERIERKLDTKVDKP